MIRLIPRRRIRIPHLAAALAALLLATSSWVGGNGDAATDAEQARVGTPELAQGDDVGDADGAPRKRKLSISLLLLGNG